MTYELAKQLKDAGFPQEAMKGHLECEHGFPDGVHDVCDVFSYVPTLEELIEACGEEFRYIDRPEKSPNWYAAGGFIKLPYLKEKGVTPTEAVARLWLALNKPLTDQKG